MRLIGILRPGLAVLALWAAAPTVAAEDTDLCAIPFTEARRSAIEHQHIPALREILRLWQAERTENSRLGNFQRDLIDDDLGWLNEMLRRVKTAAVDRTPESLDTALPDRPGSPLGLTAYDRADGEVEFRIDAAQQAALEAGLQALVHWACATDDPLTLSELLGTVDHWRGDHATFNAMPRMTYEDWKQKALILYKQMRSISAPDSMRLRGMFGPFGALILTSHDLTWWDDPARSEWLTRLRLDVADWILAADAPLQQKAGQIAYTLLGWPYQGLRDLAGPVILERLLSEYAESVSDQAGVSLAEQVARARLDAEMGSAAVYVGRSEMALCFRNEVDAAAKNPNLVQGPARFKALTEAYQIVTFAISSAGVLEQNRTAASPPCHLHGYRQR